MCGIFAIASKEFIPLELIKNILLELKIRGKHSTGISWIEKEKLNTDIQPVSADNFKLKNIKTKVIIGHTRYSTSSLEYNQPITNNNISAVHNGVITQQDSKYWDNKNYKFKTKNDSEYIVKSFLLKKHPLIEYPKASISSCVINKNNNTLQYFRNDKRPLWYKDSDDILLAISTKNIFDRLNIKDPKKCISCTEYKINYKNNITVNQNQISQSTRDLQ